MLVSRFPFLVFRFCFRFRSLLYHTPSALRARPPCLRGTKWMGHFFLLCPSKLGGRGAKRRRGYVSFPFLVFRLSYPLRPVGLSPCFKGTKWMGHFFLLCPSKLGGRGAKRRRGMLVSRFSFSVYHTPPPCGLVPLSQVDKVDGPFLSSRRRLK